MQRVVSSMVECGSLREEALRIYFFSFWLRSKSRRQRCKKTRDMNGREQREEGEK